MKEDIYFLLESKRDRVRHIAALTLQRYVRMFFVRKRYTAFRMKIIRLQAHCRGFLARYKLSFITKNPSGRTPFVKYYFTFFTQETVCENESQPGEIPLSDPYVR